MDYRLNAQNCAMHEDNLLVTNNRQVPPYQLFFNKESPFVRTLQKFGELCMISDVQKKIKGKLKDRGTVCMFVGYCPDHPSDMYRMLNMKTRKVRTSKDVYKWLDTTYGEKLGLTKSVTLLQENENEDDDNEEGSDPVDLEKEVVEIPDDCHVQVVDEEQGSPRKLSRYILELETSYNNPTENVQEGRYLRSGREDWCN